MEIEILLECTVNECPHNIGCMCRATKDVAINHHGVCVKAGVLPGFQKTSDNKEENPNSTQQLKDSISLILLNNIKLWQETDSKFKKVAMEMLNEAIAKLESV